MKNVLWRFHMLRSPKAVVYFVHMTRLTRLTSPSFTRCKYQDHTPYPVSFVVFFYVFFMRMIQKGLNAIFDYG